MTTHESNPRSDGTDPSELANAQTLVGDSSHPARADPGSGVPAQLGEFVVERRLGSGGMGEVFAATHVETGERVALKRLTGASATGSFTAIGEHLGPAALYRDRVLPRQRRDPIADRQRRMAARGRPD